MKGLGSHLLVDKAAGHVIDIVKAFANVAVGTNGDVFNGTELGQFVEERIFGQVDGFKSKEDHDFLTGTHRCFGGAEDVTHVLGGGDKNPELVRIGSPWRVSPSVK